MSLEQIIPVAGVGGIHWNELTSLAPHLFLSLTEEQKVSLQKSLGEWSSQGEISFIAKAKASKKYYEKLLSEGFSSDQAILIVAHSQK
jgi:hypothetical protein